jgi:N-sulfoglucosamine sulfohydrolase
MTGLAHRGWRLKDHSHHFLHELRKAGYHSELIGEQHISRDTREIGYDRVHDVGTNHVHDVAPVASHVIREELPEPFFLSVGFFETHRNFFEPSSVRDTQYSLPPAGLPDLPETRRDMAAFKQSARRLDQGVGTVLDALWTRGVQDHTLVICTTDHGLAFPGAKATLSDRGIGVMLIVRGPGFSGGRVVDSLVSQVDLHPTLCELAGVRVPDYVQGRSLLPLVRGEVDAVRDEVFAELTYHVAYEPQRAIRTERFKYIRRFDDDLRPALANVDDGPTKTALLQRGWGRTPNAPEELYDLVLDPGEVCNRAGDPAYANERAALRAHLERWMRDTNDPLLDGPVPPPEGALIASRDAISPDEAPMVGVGSAVR